MSAYDILILLSALVIFSYLFTCSRSARDRCPFTNFTASPDPHPHNPLSIAASSNTRPQCAC